MLSIMLVINLDLRQIAIALPDNLRRSLCHREELALYVFSIPNGCVCRRATV